MGKSLSNKYHLIGIGGIGMSGLARILLSRGMQVSGSDLAQNPTIAYLTSQGAKIFSEHEEGNVPSQATVIYSTDIKQDNPEMQSAIKQKCRMIHRSDLLLELTNGYKTLAVSGTHGKTTTSSLLTWTLDQGDLSPAYAVGGIIPQFESNAGHGTGEYFVAEADESDGTFLTYDSFGTIITNIGLDHMSTYGTEKELLRCFQTFMNNVSSDQHLFWCGDDIRLKNLNTKGYNYGFGSRCDLHISNYEQKEWGMKMDLHFLDQIFSNVEVALTGQHNALNAAAVFGLALQVGVSEEKIRKALASFKGVQRRCEKKGEINDILFLDDYAHHPTEIKTTLQGIRKAIQNRRLIVIFQPHRYSRTKDCLGTYKGIFDPADQLIITDIFAARETPIPGITPQALINEISENSQFQCQYEKRNELSDRIAEMVESGDVVVTLGAGDVTHVGGEVMKKVQREVCI